MSTRHDSSSQKFKRQYGARPDWARVIIGRNGSNWTYDFDQVDEFITQHASGRYSEGPLLDGHAFYFEDPEVAVLFQLRFG